VRKYLPCILFLFTTALAQNGPVAVRILMGMTDQENTRWDGSVTARDATIAGIDPWRFEQEDSVSGNSWKASSRPARLFGGAIQWELAKVPVVPNGVIVLLSNRGANAELAVTTPAGNFSVRLADLTYGKTMSELNGRVAVDLVPPTTQITKDPDEQDQPAAAVAKDGTVWMAYLNFIHNKDHNRIRSNFKQAPSSFADMKAPTGGDQILVRSFSGGRWSEPVEVAAAGDVWRPSVTVDGAGTPWVVWAQNQSGNFDIWARPVPSGKPGKAVRLSSDAGVDMDAVATTDSQGRVWVAWQGWRNGRATIMTSSGKDGTFSPGKAVAPASGNQWNPAIAADSQGRVSVAWDSYENGNYDVFARTSVNGAWGKVATVAATARYEAYPSIAYDPEGRLWVAYEEGAEGWGKDFGAYSSSGVAVYQGRAIRLVGFTRSGAVVKTVQDPGAVLPGPTSITPTTQAQNDADSWLTADPRRIDSRPKNRPTKNLMSPKNTSPRLTVDGTGRMWLVVRSVHPVWWTSLGTVWSEYVLSYFGTSWTPPVFLHHSDNLLDNRPALASTGPGELMIIHSSDYRRDFTASQRDPQPLGIPLRDPYNNDLFASTIRILPAAGKLETVAGTVPAAATPTPDIKAERDAIARMRSYRLKAGSQTLRLARGEFHRHSEVSGDGGFDGTLLDQWRYIIDAAALDWVGCCDHDNGNGREYTWWMNQKETDLFYSPGHFSPLFSYERSVAYPEGHRNVLFEQRGIRTLPRLPKMDPDSSGKAPDTAMLYRYLKEFRGVVASHTSATGMGTDWRDNDGEVETSVEIYQGDRQNYEKPGAPRSSSQGDSIGGYRPKGYVDLALEMGYKMAFEASSDHVSTHMSFANALTTAYTREALMDAFRKRHVYASTDNILAEFRAGDHVMGDAFTAPVSSPPTFQVKLAGTGPFAKVVIVKDNQYVYSQEPKKPEVSFTWRDTAAKAGAKPSYYYVRGEQENGEIVWISPMWVTYQ
jgi:hypothetical protein